MIDHRIALMGQQPNIINALSQGTQAAGQTAALQRQAELQNLYREQGPGIMRGETNALRAMSQLDPQAAMAVDQSRRGFDMSQRQAQQNLQIGEAQLTQIKQKTAQSAQAHAAKLSAAEAAAEAQKIQAGLTQVLPMVVQAKETGDVAPLNQALQAMGMPPVRDVNEALIRVAQHEGVYETLTRVTEMTTPDERAPGNDYERYALRERQAGREPMGEFEYRQAVAATKNDAGISMTMPDGTRVQVGGSQQQGGGVDPSGPGYMLDTVNSILADEALDSATGLLAWTQAVPGTGMYRFGTRVKQLQGQAFLQAFESLKGGGQITEIEGQKATQAIGRIDSGMESGDFREAMQELQEILGRALKRPRGWADTSAGKISVMSAEELGALDLGALNDEERAAARERLNDLISAEIGDG